MSENRDSTLEALELLRVYILPYIVLQKKTS